MAFQAMVARGPTALRALRLGLMNSVVGWVAFELKVDDKVNVRPFSDCSECLLIKEVFEWPIDGMHRHLSRPVGIEVGVKPSWNGQKSIVSSALTSVSFSR
jgi:hypothetical protein